MTSGHLRVTAGFDGTAITRLQVHLERPPVARLFSGMTPAQAVVTVPLLYALCTQAQGRAAAAALAAAQGEILAEADARRLWVEALHEHLWRLLLDWPVALGLEAPREAFAVWRKCRQATLPVLLLSSEQLLGQTLGIRLDSPGELLFTNEGMAARCLARLGAIEQDVPRAEVMDPLPWLESWCSGAPGGSLPPVASPASGGVAYARRLSAVLSAWQALVQGLPYPVTAAGRAGEGVGLVATARGVLVHGVKLAEGGESIAEYQVWAPTDRFFAEENALAGLLEGRCFDSHQAARRALELAILALDPCVPYTVAWMEN